MENLYPLLRSVAIFFLLVILIRILYARGIFSASHLPIFGKLITEFILPITIFSTLAVSTINYQYLQAAALFVSATVIACSIAYLICRALAFSRPITGTIVILSGFGSTSTLAYPLITQAYADNANAMAATFIIGEFGSCIPFFTLGVLILVYFGTGVTGKDQAIVSILKSFLKTPIFFSLVFGLLASQIPIVSGIFASDFFTSFFTYFNNGFEIMVAITVGLMLRAIKVRDILLYASIPLSLSLIVTPLLVYTGSNLVHTSPITQQILVIMASVPSGAVAAVMSERYGCDGSLASTIVILSFLVSLITLPTLAIILLK
ncbi:MAG: AEC family transporter [Halobacteriota archaeon]